MVYRLHGLIEEEIRIVEGEGNTKLISFINHGFLK